jgi:hypothetical protein
MKPKTKKLKRAPAHAYAIRVVESDFAVLEPDTWVVSLYDQIYGRIIESSQHFSDATLFKSLRVARMHLKEWNKDPLPFSEIRFEIVTVRLGYVSQKVTFKSAKKQRPA